MPAKFKGKSPEEIAKAYRNLEKRLGKRQIPNTERRALAKEGLSVADVDVMREAQEAIEKMDFSKMDPKEFALWITEHTTKTAQRVMETTNEVNSIVRTEISEATKKYPLLRENKEYRGLVLSIIEGAAAKGEIVTVTKACEKVNAFLGKTQKVTEKKTKSKKQEVRRKRTAVESAQPGSGRGVRNEADRVRAGVMGAGSSAQTGLGGLF